jgi:HPr kinase/phosphorylase
LQSAFDRCVNIHASCVLLADAGMAFGTPRNAGVLLLGQSGAGKSDIALRMIELGALLVSDDRTELFVHNGALIARPPTSLAGLLEIFGMGIMKMQYAASADIGLAVALQHGKPERLPRRETYQPPRELHFSSVILPPLIRLDATEPSAVAKILAAAAAFHHHSLCDTLRGQIA